MAIYYCLPLVSSSKTKPCQLSYVAELRALTVSLKTSHAKDNNFIEVRKSIKSNTHWNTTQK